MLAAFPLHLCARALRCVLRCCCALGRRLQGVLGMSWCPQDASFLLSTAKDNRTICWDVAAAEVYCEMPSTNNWNFDVQVRLEGV